jgi:ketosteroid isomerase-like protein
VRASGPRSLQPARLDALLALMDPAVRFTRFVERSDPYDGPDGVRAWWEDLLRVFPDFTVEVVQVRDAGELTVNAVRVRGHGLGSETPFAETIWQVGELRAGKAISWHSYGSEAEALEAGGLEK